MFVFAFAFAKICAFACLCSSFCGDTRFIRTSNAQDVQNLFKIRRPKAAGDVPTFGGTEPRTVTAHARTVDHVREGGETLLVQPGVEPTHGGFPLCDQGVVDEGKDARHGRGGATRAVDGADGRVEKHNVPVTLGRDVRVGAARGVVQALELVADGVEVPFDGGVLPARPGKVVAEPAARGVTVAGVEGDPFRVAPRAADGGHVGAGGREGGQEGGGVFAVVADAAVVAADAVVARAEEQGNALGPEGGELVADLSRVGSRHGLFVVAVRGRHDLGQGGRVLVAHPQDPGQVGLVGVFGGEGVGLEGWHAARRVRRDGGRVDETQDGLEVQVPFDAGARGGVVDRAAVDGHLLQRIRRVDGLGAEVLEVQFGVGATRNLAEVVGEADRVVLDGSRRVVDGVVQRAQTFGRHAGEIADLAE